MPLCMITLRSVADCFKIQTSHCLDKTTSYKMCEIWNDCLLNFVHVPLLQLSRKHLKHISPIVLLRINLLCESIQHGPIFNSLLIAFYFSRQHSYVLTSSCLNAKKYLCYVICISVFSLIARLFFRL